MDARASSIVHWYSGNLDVRLNLEQTLAFKDWWASKSSYAQRAQFHRSLKDRVVGLVSLAIGGAQLFGQEVCTYPEYSALHEMHKDDPDWICPMCGGDADQPEGRVHKHWYDFNLASQNIYQCVTCGYVLGEQPEGVAE